MRIAVEMQQLGPDVASGTIVEWLVAVGDDIERGDPLVDVETDKTTMELKALDSGLLVEIVHGAGVDVAVGEVIGYLEGGTT